MTPPPVVGGMWYVEGGRGLTTTSEFFGARFSLAPASPPLVAALVLPPPFLGQAWAWKAYRGFVERGDVDSYEFDLNCKPADSAAQAVRKMPSVRQLVVQEWP